MSRSLFTQPSNRGQIYRPIILLGQQLNNNREMCDDGAEVSSKELDFSFEYVSTEHLYLTFIFAIFI